MGLESRALRAVAIVVAVALSGAAGASAGVHRHAPPRGARTIHTYRGVAAPSGAVVGTAPASGALVRSFDAVGSRDSGITNFGAEFEPPDQGLSA